MSAKPRGNRAPSWKRYLMNQSRRGFKSPAGGCRAHALAPRQSVPRPTRSVLLESVRSKRQSTTKEQIKMSKPDISTAELLRWDEYKDKKPDEALASIYKHIESTSKQMCAWYWTSIKVKRRT